MKELVMVKRRYYFLFIVFILLFSNIDSAFGDLGRIAPYKDQANSAVFKIIQDTGLIQVTAEELTAVLDQFDKDKGECLKATEATVRADCMEELAALLEKGKALFQKLSEQAKSVEAEIAAGMDRLGDRHIDRLERILKEVRSMRMLAAAELNSRQL